MKRQVLWLALALACLAGAAPAAAQQRRVTGTVLDNGGQALAGASVTQVGGRVGVVTDAGGAFALPLPAGDARIRVSALGFRAREVLVPAAESAVTVRLEVDALGLEAVVVTGQATQVRRENVAHDVAVVTGQDLAGRVPAQTVDLALQGKIAGATIRSNSGAPGGGAQIRVRGTTTLTGNSTPLYVVDGVIVSDAAIPGGANAISRADTRVGRNASDQDNVVNRIADLNPADIESIEVLKGASAASIYGSRAAAGVVIINTRRGRAGAPRFTFSQRLGVASIARKLGSRTWTRDQAIELLEMDEETADLYFGADGAPKGTYDLEEQVYGREAPQSETSFGVSGGSETTQYYVSGTVTDNQGIAPNTGYQKQSGTLNLRQMLGGRVQLTASTTVTHSVASRGITGNDNTGASYTGAIAITPSFFSFERGDAASYPRNPFLPNNPLETAMLSRNDEDVWRVIGSLGVSADLVRAGASTLRFAGTAGADYFNQNNLLYFPPSLQLQPFPTTPGTAVSGGGANRNVNVSANLVHTLAPSSGAFRATTSVGLQYDERDLRLSQVTGRFLLGDLDLPYQAATQVTAGQRQRTAGVGAYLQEELLLLDERLSLTASVRGDRNSNNADVSQPYFYPKLAGAYSFTPGGAIEALKLRVAYGSSGNQPLWGQKYTALTTVNVGGVPAVVVTGGIGAPDLRPERVSEIEGGFDATLAGGRAQLAATAYRRNITDLLLTRALSTSTGFSTQFFNGGVMESKGLELSLQANPVHRGNLDWTSTTTFSRNRAKVTELPVPAFTAAGAFGAGYGEYRIVKGHSPTEIWANNGFDAEGNRVTESIGDSEPDFQMGFLNEVRVGRFSLGGLVDWSRGGKVVNLTKNYYDHSGTTPDFFMPEGVTEPRDPHCGCLSGQERLEYETAYPVYVEDAGFVKLREVSLTYEVPTTLLGRRVSSAQLSLSGRNLRTWTPYTGYDPEVSNFGNQAAGRNMDVAPFPPSRTFWVGLNLVF